MRITNHRLIEFEFSPQPICYTHSGFKILTAIGDKNQPIYDAIEFLHVPICLFFLDSNETLLLILAYLPSIFL